MFISKENQKVLWLAILLAMLCSIATFCFTAKYYSGKYDTLNAEYTAYKAQYASIAKEKEEAVISLALAEKAAKVPVKEYVKGDTVTQIEYVERTSSTDTNLEVTNKVKPVVVSYNGKSEELATTTKEGSQIVDGKFVITQQSSTTIDIDSIVKREIANYVLENEKEKAVLNRQKKQQTFWGTAAGIAIGKLID